MKKVFISYSRKNDQDIFEFRSQEKNREFEILIDDEDLKFDAPWKQSIIKKITEADAAILFISNDALKPESPIRTLELPLIAKRIRDENDNFIFFPIFLEEVDRETLENYEFTIDGTNEKVNFLDFFQVLDITKQNKLKEARRRARNNFFRDINGNISASLKGEGIFSNVLEISRIRQKQRVQNVGIVFAVILSLFLFTRTDTFAKVLINAAERLQPESPEEGSGVLFNAIAGQLDNIENLEELGADDSLLESIEDVNELNLNDSISQNVEDFNAVISDDSTTTTTLGTTTTTTTLGTTTTTTLGTTTVDTDAPIFNKGLTAENITSSTVDISWSATDNVGISYYVLREGSFVIYEGSSTSKEVEGLMSSKTYTFSVDAYDNAGNVSTSNVSFITLTGTTTTTTTSTTTTTVAPTYGVPTIYAITINGSNITAYYNDAQTNTGKSIVGHGCEYSTIEGGPSGGTSTQSYSSSCSLDFPIQYETVSIKVKQSFEGQVSCGDGCYTDNWSGWSNTITVDLSGEGSTNDSSVNFVWNRPDIGPGCYPDTYPKNRQVNNILLPLTEADVRQSLLDYGSGYGRLCGDDLVNAYVNHWKAKTADDIKSLYPSWSENQLSTYLNGSGSGNSWDTGWYTNWNSTPLTTTTTTTASCVGVTFPAPPDNELYIFGTLDVSNCQVLTTGFQCAQNCVGLVNQTADGKTQAYFWAENNSASWLSNWTGYYQPSSGKFYVTSSGQGGGFEFTPPYQGP